MEPRGALRAESSPDAGYKGGARDARPTRGGGAGSVAAGGRARGIAEDAGWLDPEQESAGEPDETPRREGPDMDL